MTPAAPETYPRIRFDRNELAGAFGDIGTDLPLIVGMILASRLDAATVLIMFGAMQIFTGLFYGMPMPAQPLKAVAVIVITQKLAPDVIYGGGLAIGVVMLLLTITGLVAWLGRVIPKVVVRGIQFGLGLQLATLALKDYLPKENANGYVLAAIAAVIAFALYNNRRYPAALFIIGLGFIYAFAFKKFDGLQNAVGLAWPKFHVPAWSDILTGFLILALPQVPLSIGNSVLGARRVAEDLFPTRAPSLTKIGLTYSFMNLVNPFFGGVPTCHGSGGLAGHYAFGARTGMSVIIYGSMYLIVGLFFSNGFENVFHVFPLPILGVILAFEATALMLLVRDMTQERTTFFLVIITGLMACLLPYGYLVALISGTILAYTLPKHPQFR
ncbi:MAG: transporter [Verrucomicrobiales bacterium]|nr:transporter [Verrucomicrobiales bacterium]